MFGCVRMRRFLPFLLSTTIFFALFFLPSAAALAQGYNDNILSQHIRLRVPMEREYIARDVILELESCWSFTNRSLGDKLPRKVWIEIRWDETVSRAEPAAGKILIGMGHPAASVNEKQFVLRNAARELARLGLLADFRGGPVREEAEFLLEGMSEILARDFSLSTKSLASAWVQSQLLDRMGQLGLKQQSPWVTFSGGQHGLRASAPGITFLLTCREMFGREKILKLFDALRTRGLEESIGVAFKSSVAVVEAAWLKKVREYPANEEFIAGPEDAAPRLERSLYQPDNPRAGSSVQFRFYIRRGVNALLPEGIYFRDETSGRVIQATPVPEKNAGFAAVAFPLEAGRQPGSYSYHLIALDEGGNVRIWPGTYEVKP